VEIIVKATPDRADGIEQAVAQRVGEALGNAARVTVSRLFPHVKSGHRARMLVVRLPDGLSSGEVNSILERLRAAEGVEYAEPPAPRKPMRGL
jgi:hypothetical protein